MFDVLVIGAGHAGVEAAAAEGGQGNARTAPRCGRRRFDPGVTRAND